MSEEDRRADLAAQDLAAKDKRIDDLVLQAEKLVADLNVTVSDMKRILSVQEAMNEQRRDRA